MSISEVLALEQTELMPVQVAFDGHVEAEARAIECMPSDGGLRPLFSYCALAGYRAVVHLYRGG